MKVFPVPPGEAWDMGSVKAIIGVVVIAAAIYVGFQVVPPELSNYSFQDDLRTIAMSGGANPHVTDQALMEEVMKKAEEHQIPLSPDQVVVQRIGSVGAPAVYLQADYSVPVTLPGYQFSLHFNPSSGNKGF